MTTEASAAGKIYEQVTAAVVASEFDRKKTLEGRGSTLVTASASLLTLTFGVIFVVTGKDYLFKSGWAVGLLLASLAAFLVSAVIAVFVAVEGTEYAVIADETLDALTTEDKWNKTEDNARLMWVRRQVDTAKSLRESNNKNVTRVAWSLWIQVLAIALLAGSVVVELSDRSGHSTTTTTTTTTTTALAPPPPAPASLNVTCAPTQIVTIPPDMVGK